MKIQLPYGRNTLEVDLPDKNLTGVFLAGEMQSIADPAAETLRCLRQPLGTPPLRELARGKKDACVVISDVTRYLPYPSFLPSLLTELEAAGIPRDKITILVATGLHRKTTEEELIEMLGQQTADAYQIANHVARDQDSCQFLGNTPGGMPVHVNKLYMKAELRILVGMIEQHLMAGYSGGRKSLCPGICGAETIKYTHSPVLLEDPGTSNGHISDNPFHREVSSAAEMAGVDFVLNVVLRERKDVAGVFAGNLTEAFSAGVAFLEQYILADCRKASDVVVTSCTGYPLDTTFYQTIKGMVAALDLVKPGGTVIIASQLAEGIGSDDFTSLTKRFTTIEDFMASIEKNEVIIDQWMLEELNKVLRKASVMLYCEGGAVSADEARGLFVEPISSLEEGIEKCLAKYGPDATIAALPQGEYLKAVAGSS
jgi:nickel-dependent lactate racemase